MTKKLLYQTVIDYIKTLITDNNYSVGDLIPSESKICQILGVSVGTVRKGIDYLEQRGLLYRHHGKGTYICDSDFNNKLFNFVSYGDKDGTPISVYKTTPIREKITASKKITDELGLVKGDKVIHLKRHGHSDDNQLIMIENSYWSAKQFDGLQNKKLYIPDLLYKVITQNFHTPIAFSNEVLNSTIADKKNAFELNINIGDPIIMLTRRTYTNNNKIIEFRVTRSRADMFSYRTIINNRKLK